MSDNCNEASSIFWSDIKKYREEIRNRYPSLLKIPVIYCTKKRLMENVLSDFEGKLLDIGAGDRFVHDICSYEGSKIEYRSMDLDSSRYHDYYSLTDIKDTFRGITLLDIIEHLSLKEGIDLLEDCSRILEPDGKIFITIPNNYHPTAFAVDCTHTTSYRCHDLGGMLLMLGFRDVQVFRVSAKRKMKYRLLASLLKPVIKLFDVDYATGIFITARKAA